MYDKLKYNIQQISQQLMQLSKANEDTLIQIQSISEKTISVAEVSNKVEETIVKVESNLEKFIDASKQIIEIAGQTN
ncbi:MAG: hypothetical protein QXD03_05370, partial [Candidatus Anstonellales archaeon]